MSWEVDWANPLNTGDRVIARNPAARRRQARAWHLTSTGYLRNAGVNTPVYRKDSWEVDWTKRNGKAVWARNPMSKMPRARDWHWIHMTTLLGTGVRWRPKSEKNGRYVNSDGYVNLTRRGMTTDEVGLAEKHGLFKGKRKSFVREHHLVAVKKYGALPPRTVVRHLNGDKSDNRPENIVIGTVKENSWDHLTACRMAMFWRGEYEKAEATIRQLRECVLRYVPERVNDWSAVAEIRRVMGCAVGDR